MHLTLFQQDHYLIGIPIERSQKIYPVEQFHLTLSSIHPTIWNFELQDASKKGFLLHFPNAIFPGKTKFHHEDKILFCNQEKSFAVLFRNPMGFIKDLELSNLQIEPFRLEEKRESHFIRVFFKEAFMLNNSRVFFIQLYNIYSAYQHVIENVES